MEKMVRCTSCGAEFDVSLVRCPYCGTANAPAEEGEYMDKLEAVREDLHQQTEKSDTKIQKRMARTIRTILLVAVMILLIVFVSFWLSDRQERSRSNQKKEEFLRNQGITTQQEVNDR